MRWFRRRREEPERPREEHAPPAAGFAERMSAELERLRWSARRAGGHLPVAALPRLGEIEDVLVPLVEHLATSPPTAEEEFAVQAMITDYLPTSLNAYIALNKQVAGTVRPDGRTAGDDLMEQLVLLEEEARTLSTAVYAHDAQRLATQGRFLRTKFGGTDLDLA